MKKLLALLLSLMMVLVLVPATVAEGEDFTLVIKGGNVDENLSMHGGKNLLAVDVALNSAVEDTLLTVTFDLTYNPEQITFADYEKDDAFDMQTINDETAGTLCITSISTVGIPAAEEQKVTTLYFELAENLEAGTEIAFELGEDAVAETFTDDASKVTPHGIAADFAPFVVTSGEIFNGVVKFNEGEVEYKGQTPYVIWDSAKGVFEPAFTVYEEDGETVIPAENYDFEYKENKAPGTGYLFVYFKGAYTGTAQLFFKIYLPATSKTWVENVADGIRVSWMPVDGAAGYVIYRRAWSSTTNGWTAFARWDNTTETTWLDGHDESHKVYAGTRYQYGIKAYFARRTDPVSGAEIGGNVNEDSGNFNLGMIGQLKTTVRITTRKLVQVRSGNKELTVKWEASKNFTGYQIQYATNEAFTENAVAIKIEDPATYWTTLKNLEASTVYYVRIRSYHIFENMTYFGEWSNVISQTTN